MKKAIPKETLRNAPKWTPQIRRRRDKERVASFVRPKFVELLAEMEEHDRTARSDCRIWGKTIRLNDLPRHSIVKHLQDAGFDRDDIEEFADRRDEYLSLMRGSGYLVERWTEWFFRELSGTKIAGVIGRPVTPENLAKWESAQFPKTVFGEITEKLFREFLPDIPIKGNTIRRSITVGGPE